MHSQDCDMSSMLVVQLAKKARWRCRCCLRKPQPIGLSSVKKDQSWRHKTNTKSYSILSRMKQLFNFFSVTNIRQKSWRVSIPVKIYNKGCWNVGVACLPIWQLQVGLVLWPRNYRYDMILWYYIISIIPCCDGALGMLKFCIVNEWSNLILTTWLKACFIFPDVIGE